MRKLSISAAWDETKAIFARDGQLLIAVALAMIVLPSTISGLVSPAGASPSTSPWWVDLISVVSSLIALAGQLALIRLALGPSITVGGAIGHGLRRLPIYFLFLMIVALGLFLAAIPLAFVLTALGVQVNQRPVPSSPALVVGTLIFMGFAVCMAVRLLMSSSVASAEDTGPIMIMKRSWHLTKGVFWPLLGFLLVFAVAALVSIYAVGSATNVVVQLLIGPPTALSVGALILALIQAAVSAAITVLFAVMLARIYRQLAGAGEAQAGVPSSGT